MLNWLKRTYKENTMMFPLSDGQIRAVLVFLYILEFGKGVIVGAVLCASL